MSFYRDQRRGHDTYWPHFDRRGPDYYYDDERYPDRSFDGSRNGRYYQERFADSDIYEDEFRPENGNYERYGRHDHWPEDRFYYHRYRREPEENFFERGWHKLRDQWREIYGVRPPSRGYPEDHHHGPYGREYRAHNANRGSGGHDRFSW